MHDWERLSKGLPLPPPRPASKCWGQNLLNLTKQALTSSFKSWHDCPISLLSEIEYYYTVPYALVLSWINRVALGLICVVTRFPTRTVLPSEKVKSDLCYRREMRISWEWIRRFWIPSMMTSFSSHDTTLQPMKSCNPSPLVASNAKRILFSFTCWSPVRLCSCSDWLVTYL